MCMLFVYLNDGTDHEVGYKMVLISNRDEYWERPTDPACFRGEDKLWIGGIDLEPGREGGTWLGINRYGQIGVLLNILAVQELNKKGRGNLVTDFITNTQLSCEEYLDNVASGQTSYNPFQLILVDLRKQPPCFHYLNNVENSIEHSRKILHQKILSVDNSINSCNIPWCKTQNGKTKFLDIVQKYGDVESKDILIEKCIDLLNDKTRYFPDPQLQQQFRDVGRPDKGCVIEERCALNVFSPSVKYGTRTNTVILVDNKGNCDYVERTLETPVNIEHPQYTTVKYGFRLDTGQLLNGAINPNL